MLLRLPDVIMLLPSSMILCMSLVGRGIDACDLLPSRWFIMKMFQTRDQVQTQIRVPRRSGHAMASNGTRVFFVLGRKLPAFGRLY
jgi:hypothetical protein